MRNIGPRSANWLRDAGVLDENDLRQVGVIEAWKRCADNGHPVSLNLAYALEAALLGLDWRDLPDEARTRLRGEIARLEAEEARVQPRAQGLRSSSKPSR